MGQKNSDDTNNATQTKIKYMQQLNRSINKNHANTHQRNISIQVCYQLPKHAFQIMKTSRIAIFTAKDSSSSQSKKKKKNNLPNNFFFRLFLFRFFFVRVYTARDQRTSRRFISDDTRARLSVIFTNSEARGR